MCLRRINLLVTSNISGMVSLLQVGTNQTAPGIIIGMDILKRIHIEVLTVRIMRLMLPVK